MSTVQDNGTRRYKKTTRAKNGVNGEVEGNVSKGVEDEAVEQKQENKSNGLYAKIARIRKHGTLYDAREITVKYASVYYPLDLRGIWRLAGKSTVQLTDCYIDILRVVKPLPTSNSRDFTIFIRFTNPRGETLDHTVSRQGIDEDTLDAQFVKFGRLPEKDNQKRYLIEAIKEIVREAEVMVQMQADALGWYQIEDNRLVWLVTNGVETSEGFLTEDLAPFVAPGFNSPGNGYYGCEVEQSDDKVMHILLEQLLPGGSTLIASLLGLATRIMIPILTDDLPGMTPGMLRFCSEIIGPPRHGKSRLLNAILLLFGIKFDHDRASLLNEHGGSDSKIGRLGLTAVMRFQLFADFDHKVSPGNSLFEKIHNIRGTTNNIYSDDTGGGVVGTQRGGMRARAKPVGALVRTSNYDHAEYGLRHDEENIEARCCSFTWPKSSTNESGYEKADDDISRVLEDNKPLVYAWGVAYRRWYMHMHMETILALVEEKGHIARARVNQYSVDSNTWGCDLHRNQCVDMVLGLLMWLQFLQDVAPTSFMVAWVEQQIEEVIKDRLKRCLYVHTMAGKFSEENKLVEYIVQTMRTMFITQQWYVTTQQHEILAPSDTTFTLEKYGYRRVVKQGAKDSYECGRTEIAHLIKHKEYGECLAFDTLLLYDTLVRESERLRLTLPDKDNLIEQMVDTGVALQFYDKQRNKHTPSYPVKVGGKTERFTLVRVDAIYPTTPNEDVSTDVDEDILEHTHERNGNIVPFNPSKNSLEDLLGNM